MSAFDKNFLVRFKAMLERHLKESGFYDKLTASSTHADGINRHEAVQDFINSFDEKYILEKLNLEHAIVPKYAIGDTVFFMYENHIIKGAVQEIRTKTTDWSINKKEVDTSIRYKVRRDGILNASDNLLKFDEEELYISPDGIIEDLLNAAKEP